MSKAKHTPGPWAVDPRRPQRVVEMLPEGRGPWRTIANVGETWTGPNTDEAEANAALIAAAPEMLELLKEILGRPCYGLLAGYPHLQDRAMVAINKAQGGGS